MTLIQQQVLGSPATLVTFTGIPQTFKTLKLVMDARSDLASTWSNGSILINGSTASETECNLYGTGTGVGTGKPTPIETHGAAASATASVFGSVEVVIPNYAGSTYKPISIDIATENGSAAALLMMAAGLFSSAAPITSLGLSADSSNVWVAGSIFALYGLA